MIYYNHNLDKQISRATSRQRADDKDINRKYVNYGSTTAYVDVLRELGHEVDVPVWEDEKGCLKIPKLNIDGKVLEF